MPKSSINSEIQAAEAQKEMWEQIAVNKQALLDKNKTNTDAIILANYYEGKRDGLIDARKYIK